MAKTSETETLSTLENAIIGASSTDNVQRYGEAARQYVMAYSGTDAGERLTRGLKSISESQVNPNWTNNNLKQQAGYSAEVKYVADENAQAIINGNDTRYIRTDDLGNVNDPLFDHVKLDASGSVIAGSGEQMKFIGKDAHDWFQKITTNKDFQKYFDENAKLTCPSDYYHGILNEADIKISKLQTQIEQAKAEGYTDVKAMQDLEKCYQVKENLQDSGITSKEAMFARTHPALSTVKDIASVSHKAGLAQIKWGAIIGGGISFCKNFQAVWNDEISKTEFVKRVGVDAGKAAMVSYVSTAGGTAIAGAMTNSSSAIMQQLGSTALPAMAAVATLEVGKSLWKLKNGEITPHECMLEIRDKSIALTGSTVGAWAGQMLIPIPVVGALVGSVVGSVISTFVFKECISINSQVEMAHEHRLALEAQCAEAIRQIRQQRMQMQMIAAQYMSGYMQMFNQTFDLMKDAIVSDNIDEFIFANNLIIEKCGGTIQYKNFDEFRELMNSNTPLIF